MKLYLEPVKNVLRSFFSEISEIEKIRKSISEPIYTPFNIKDQTPDLSGIEFKEAPESYWERENAYIWLYADAWDYHSLMRRPKPSPIPEYYSQPAWPLYQQWQKEDKEVIHRKCEKIPPPAEGVSLTDYLQKLALTVSEENEHRDVWVESLRSFIQFLRDDMELDQKGPLEILFPSKESCKGMELRKGNSLKRQSKEIKTVECRYILRSIEDTVYPIDILTASEILMHICSTVLEGRPNSQRSAAEALGFAWLCHAVGCYRLVTREDLVFSAEITSFKVAELSKPSEWFKPTHFIGISSLYGIIDVPVSKTLYDFLLALPREPGNSRVFSMDLDTVSRTFRNKGVKQSNRAQHLGQITFLTFMSQPHEAIGHRPFINQKFSKL